MRKRNDSLPRKRLRLTGNANVRAKKKRILLEECNYRCVYCGVHNDEVRLTVDHIIAAVNGGSNTMDNMQMLCAPCNEDKGAIENPNATMFEMAYAKARLTKRIEERGIYLPL